MTNKHTPAPWALSQEDNFKMETLATVYNVGMGRGWVYITGKRILNDDPAEWQLRNLANAQLIAAAPELLEALKQIVKCEINRMHDLETLSKKPKSLYTFSEERVARALAAIAKAEGKNASR